MYFKQNVTNSEPTSYYGYVIENFYYKMYYMFVINNKNFLQKKKKKNGTYVVGKYRQHFISLVWASK